MVDVKIILAFIWVAVMLTYLLGDVVRIFAGDFKSGEMDGKPVSSKMWMLTAIIMVIISSLLSLVSSFFSVGILSFMSVFHIFGVLAWFGLISLITRVFMVVFIYLKPAYILGDQHFGRSMIDGFKTALKNFVPSVSMYLILAAMQLFLIIITFSALIVSTVVPDVTLLRVGGMVLYYILNTILYAFLTCVYITTHDL